MAIDQNYITPAEDNAGKLTDWANEPDLRILKNDLLMATSQTSAIKSQVDNWNDMLKARGKYAPPEVKGRSKVQPKLIRKQAEWRYSSLTEAFHTAPQIFSASPSTAADVDAARQSSMVLNWQFRTKLNWVVFIDKYVRKNVDEGNCIVQVGWERQTALQTKTRPVYAYIPFTGSSNPVEQQFSQAMQNAVQVKQINPKTYELHTPDPVKAALEFMDATGQAVMAVPQGDEEYKEEVVIVNKPTIDIINIGNIYIDPTCNGDLDKARFIIVAHEMDRSMLKTNTGRYKNLEYINWDAVTPVGTSNFEYSSNTGIDFQDKTRKKFVMYEYWGYYDIHNDGTLTPFVASWIGGTMVRMELNPFPDQSLPFVLVQYNPDKDSLYGEPDAGLLIDNQQVVGAVQRGVIDLLGKSANSQMGYQKGLLDPINKRRFQNGQDYEYNPQANPLNSIIEHKYPELPNSALQVLQMQNQDAESMTGIKSFSGGLAGDAYGDVASTAKAVMSAADKRESSILRRLAKGIEIIGTKIAAMNTMFLSEKEVINVTDEQFVEITRDELRGSYDFTVKIDTAEVNNAKARDLVFMLQTVGPNMDQSLYMLILADIARLKNMPELAQKLAHWQPQPNPIQEQLQQLQLQNQQLQNQLLQSQVQLNESRSSNYGAEVQQKNLDTQEQATGVTHARAIQQTQGQAQANQNLEITKALVSDKKPDSIPGDIPAAIGFTQLSQNGGQ